MNKKEITIELGHSFWFGISFAGGCFTGQWIPFVAVIVIFGFFYVKPKDY